MNEERARKILGKWLRKDGTLHCRSPWVNWPSDREWINLDGDFTAEELEAIGWWMKRSDKAKTI